jgi:hypothetical protein
MSTSTGTHLFAVQVAFSGSVAAFCVAMLCAYPDADTRAVYLPILCSIMSVWLPSPASPTKQPAVAVPGVLGADETAAAAAAAAGPAPGARRYVALSRPQGAAAPALADDAADVEAPASLAARRP